jgi:single-strand DNA-binding protein
MNTVCLIGRLTRDPEVRFTQNNTAVANFCLAVDRRFKNQSGEKETDYINCVAWRKTAELVGQYLNKGSQVAVTGSLQMSNFTDKEGQKRTKCEVLVDSVDFLGSKRGSAQTQEESYTTPENNVAGSGQQPDDDLPF